MSGWTVVTLRAKHSEDYEYSRWDNQDPAEALEDICATLEQDEHVRAWTTDCPQAYAYLNCDRYDWDFAEQWLDDYKFMARDAVVLGANDTTDTGTARYYPLNSNVQCTDEYKETQTEDGCYVGKIALQVIGARHGIVPQDPFHDWTGRMDENWLDSGEIRAQYNRNTDD